MKEDLAERGQKFYDENLKETLEPQHTGRYVAIEPDSGRYFLDDSGTGALMRGRGEMPTGLFYLVRIGYQTADAIGGYASRNR